MTRHFARFTALAVAGALFLGTVSVASADDHSRVRVLHGSPDAPAVDVYADGTMVLENVPFGAISDYLEVPSGEHQIQVFATGTTDGAVIDATLTFDAGASYTVAATNAVASIEAQVLVDDPNPTADSAFVRAIHFSADAPAVDVAPRGSAADGAVITNLEYPNATDYLALDAGSYDLDVRLAGTDTVALELPSLAIEAGTAYSVFVIGSAADPAVGGNGLQAVVAVDAMAADDEPTDGEQPSEGQPSMPPTDTVAGSETPSGTSGTAVALIALAAIAGTALVLARTAPARAPIER